MNFFIFYLFTQSFLTPYFLGQEKSRFLFKRDTLLFSSQTRIFFSFSNRFFLGMEDKKKRALFDFQPEEFYFLVSPFKTYQIGLKIDEYLSQGYDIYYQPQNFKEQGYFWHVVSKGGIYNFGVIFVKSFGKFLFFGEGNFNLGNNLEIFAVEKDKGIFACETIFYDYIGRNLKAGFILKSEKFSFGLESGFLRKIKEKRTSKRYSLKPHFNPFFTIFLKNNYRLRFDYFHHYDSLLFPSKNTFSLSLFLGRRINTVDIGFSLKEVKRFYLGLLSEIIIKNYGIFYPEILIGYHKKNNLSEILFTFKFNTLFEEFWKKRLRRWGS